MTEVLKPTFRTQQYHNTLPHPNHGSPLRGSKYILTPSPSPCSQHTYPPPLPPHFASRPTTHPSVPHHWVHAAPTLPLPHGRWGPLQTRDTPKNPLARMKTRNSHQSTSLPFKNTAVNTNNRILSKLRNKHNLGDSNLSLPTRLLHRHQLPSRHINPHH